MSLDSLKKIQRLKEFRERQRDAAIADMEIASQQIDDARLQKEEAEKMLETELENFRNMLGKPLDPLSMETAKRCALVATQDVVVREKRLHEAHAEGEKVRSKLLNTHIKVNQMEILRTNTVELSRTNEAKAEQIFLDDLVTLKERAK